MELDQRLDSEPLRSYWLDALNVARFPDIVELEHRPRDRQEALQEAWGGGLARTILKEELTDLEDPTYAQLNLLLLDAFLEGKKTDVLLDVARMHLGDEALQGQAFQGRPNRHRIVALLFLHDPSSLLDFDLWDRWHPRRRNTLKIKGQRRNPTFDLGTAGWESAATKSLTGLGARGKALTFIRAMWRSWNNDVLLAFREAGTPDTVRDGEGTVVPGRHDEWTFIRFYDDTHWLDVTSSSPDRAKLLAEGIATSLWGSAREYQYASDPRTWEWMNKFLARLTAPMDDAFKLLEIVAEVPGRWRKPVITIGNSGQERVEQVVQDLQQTYPFATQASTVHRVKVGFEDRGKHYRTELHFPYPDDQDGALVLSYADRGWNKDVAQRFQDLVKREVNAEIHPKRLNRSKRRRDSERTEKPRKKGSEYWTAVLQPVTDDPADWILEERQRLATSGLIRLRNEAVFRCGDPLIPLRLRPDHTPECTGEIVMPFAPVNPAAPFEQESGAEYPCSSCGHRWRVDTFKPPAVHRAYVDIIDEGAWGRVEALLPTLRPPFEGEEPGVWSRRGARGREYIVNAAAASPTWLDRDRERFAPICWFVSDVFESEKYGSCAVTLVDVLAKKKKAIADVLTAWTRPMESVGAIPGRGVDSRPAPTTAGTAQGSPLPDASDLTVRVVQAGDDGLYLGGRLFCKRDLLRIHLLFALINAAHTEANEAAAGHGARQYRSAKEIASADPDGRVSDSDIHQWVRRARLLLDEAFPGSSMGTAVIESGGRKGIRLGKAFEVRNISLQEELARYKQSR